MHSNQSNHWWLAMAYSGKRPHLNWPIFLLFNLLILVIIVSIMLHHSRWLVWLIDWLVWIHRSSSTTISQAWLWSIRVCSFGCVWEWLNGWIDDSDLPKLQSIQLGEYALRGDYRIDRKTISDLPYNYKNTLTMRSEIEWKDEWIDLPSLTTIKGSEDSFRCVGSVILESS